MIKITRDLVGRLFEVAEIDQETDIVEFFTAGIDLDLVIMSVKIFALSLVAAQLVGRGKIALEQATLSGAESG